MIPRSRAGAIYTVVSITILAILAGIVFTELRASPGDEHIAVQDRVRAIDAFITNLQHDTDRAAYIAGFRAFIAMEQHITFTGEYLTDPDATFLEIFLTGELNGTPFTIMEDSSFSEYLARAKQEAGSQGVSFDAHLRDLSITQLEPWSVHVTYVLDLNVTDDKGTANWTLTKQIANDIPITDIKDPLFTKETFGRVQRVIRQTNITVFVNDAGNANDTTGLTQHYNLSAYVAAGRGPSVMMRFQGNLSDSPYGIESLVDTGELSAQELGVYTDASIVDYKYFANIPATACNIQNLTTAYQFEDASLTTYQIAGALTYSSC